MESFKPSKLNKLLAGLFCASLWRKGGLCCNLNCSCFNDVENPEADRQRAQEAKWKYRSEKLASRKEAREGAAQRRQERREAKAAKAQPGSRKTSSNLHREEKGQRQAEEKNTSEATALSEGQSTPQPPDRQVVEISAPPAVSAAPSGNPVHSNSKVGRKLKKAERKNAAAGSQREKKKKNRKAPRKGRPESQSEIES